LNPLLSHTVTPPPQLQISIHNMETIYLDHGASTPVDKKVLKAMRPYFSKDFGNPGSIHAYGQKAQKALDQARSKISTSLGVKFGEIIFTSSATEANNLFIKGSFEGCSISSPKAIISSIEHESVSEAAKALEAKGLEVIELPVSKEGIVDMKSLKDALDSSVCFVSIIYASNEIGTIQPIKEIGEMIEEYKQKNGSKYPLFHTDAVQAFQYIDIDVNKLHLDALTISGQKIYGPKGVGALYLKEEIKDLIRPQMIGGHHEFSIRSGTPNIPAIVGMGKAVEMVDRDRVSNREKTEKLRDMFLRELKKKNLDIEVNGSLSQRIPNNLNIYFPGTTGEELLIKLDMVGVAASTGSACSVKAVKKSKVIESLGFDDDRAGSSIRFTLGRDNTEKQIIETVKRVVSVL